MEVVVVMWGAQLAGGVPQEMLMEICGGDCKDGRPHWFGIGSPCNSRRTLHIVSIYICGSHR